MSVCVHRDTGKNEVNQRVNNLIATSDRYHKGNKQDVMEENVCERCPWKGLLGIFISL